MAYMRSVPIRYGVAVTALAIIGAVRFTAWYPKHRRARGAERCPMGGEPRVKGERSVSIIPQVSEDIH